MTLLPEPASANAQSGVNVVHTDLCAVVCAGSAGVHAALVAPHAHESTRLAVAFALAGVALGLAAVALAVAPRAGVVGAAAALLLSVALAYLLSRTTGIPGLTVHQEPFDALGVATSLGEAAAAVTAWRHLTARRH